MNDSENIVIMIISYARAENIPTLKSLDDANSTFPRYIIIGNDDPEIELYQEKYENVIIFDKEEYKKKVDSVDNFDISATPLYARKFCYDFAKQEGFKKFIMLDDDYSLFNIRYVKDKKLRSKKIENIDPMFQWFFNFSSPIVSPSFSQAGDYIGGILSSPAKKGWLPKIMNCFFCRTDCEIPFRGTFNDDVNAGLTLSKRGIIPITVAGFSLDQGKTQENKGGLTESYLNYGTYVKSFYSVIISPSSVSIRLMSGGTKEHRGHPRLHHSIQANKTFPKLIDEKYKK